MNDEEREELYQFFAGNWYDHGDKNPSDDEMVSEIVSAQGTKAVQAYAILLRAFLASSESAKEKADFVRDAVFIYFPAGTEAPLRWVEKIATLLENATHSTQAASPEAQSSGTEHTTT